MSVQLELWHLIVLMMSFFGAVWTMGRVLLTQIEKRLDERFSAQEKLRLEAAKRLEERVAKVEQMALGTDRALLEHKAELPNRFVHREDYIRNQSVIEAKIDAVHSKLELLQMRGKHQ